MLRRFFILMQLPAPNRPDDGATEETKALNRWAGKYAATTAAWRSWPKPFMKSLGSFEDSPLVNKWIAEQARAFGVSPDAAKFIASMGYVIGRWSTIEQLRKVGNV